MAKYKAYPDYKDSGVEWLGKVPSCWEIAALKKIATILNGSTPKSDVDGYWDGDINWITPTDLSQKKEIYLNESQRKITLQGLNSCGTTLVPVNTVILSTRAPIGSLAITGTSSCTNQGCKALVVKNKHISQFVYYYLSVSTGPLNNLGRGSTFLELSSEDLSSFKIALPNTGIGKIISFLDHETAKIDNLIEKQQQLIELLKEKRQAVISHAVTKGLNPDVPMKDSGVEWLGESPKHWLKQKLVNVGDGSRGCFVNGPFGSDLLANELQDDGVPVVYIRDIKPIGYSRKSTVYVTPKKAKQLEVCKLEPSDVIVSKVGDPPGDACVYPFGEPSAIVTQDVIRIRVNTSRFSSMFIAYLLNSDFGRIVVNDISVEGTRKRVSLGDFKATKFVFPPLQEALDIVDYLNGECEKIDSTIAKANRAVALMQERRTALISAAVTGKIDVRNWVAPEAEKAEVSQEATA